MSRERLPNRRACETVDFVHAGVKYTGTVGFYPDGRIGEIFLDAFKSGTDVQIANHDEAVMTSVAIQYGTPVKALCESVRDKDGNMHRASVKLLEMFADGQSQVS